MINRGNKLPDLLKVRRQQRKVTPNTRIVATFHMSISFPFLFNLRSYLKSTQRPDRPAI